MNNAVFRKTMEKLRKDRDIKLVTQERRRNYLVSEPNCHYYVKQKYGEKVKLCYMDTDSFIVCIKTDDIYKDIAEDVETTIATIVSLIF